MTIHDFLTTSFAPYAGIIFLFIFSCINSSMDKQIRNIFFLLSILEFFDLTFYTLELWTATFAEPRPSRTLFLVFGYSIRMVITYLFLLLSIRNCATPKSRLLWAIPVFINTVISFSAFFCDAAFSFTPDNQFRRGPLGYIPHILFAFYLVSMLFRTIRSFHGLHLLEFITLFVIVFFMELSVLLETFFAVQGLGYVATVLSTIFYYLFFQTQTYRATVEKEQKSREVFEKRSKMDGITGLFNKSAFLEEAKDAMQNNHEGSVAFVFLDLDHFKDVNDHLGHLAGDHVIQDTAKKLQNVFRNADIVGRFGGDEFCIFLQNIPRDILRNRLEETLSALRADLSTETQQILITASIGAVYCTEADKVNLQQLLELADHAAYEVKSAGRNHFLIKDYNPLLPNESKR